MIKVTFNFSVKGVWVEDFILFNDRQQAEQFIKEKVNKPFIKIVIEEI